jgi:Dual-action HEIGH metallo-peptidase
MNGTPTNPTTVHVQVDSSISSNPALNTALEKAITDWNATLGEAGRNIEFTTAPGSGPVVRIGVDSPAFDQSVSGSPVDPAHAAETEVVNATKQNGINYTNVANVILKSPGLSPSEPWNAVAPDLVEHVMLHELGHVLGLGDTSAANATDSIMWGKKGALRTMHPTTVACADIRALQSL